MIIIWCQYFTTFISLPTYCAKEATELVIVEALQVSLMSLLCLIISSLESLLIQIYFLLIRLHLKCGDPLGHAQASLFLNSHHQIEWDKQFNIHFSLFAQDGEETRDIFLIFH